MIRLLAFVLPLGLDSFAVAAALGAARPAGFGQRLRISAIFVVFEAGMPLIGLALGSGLARVIGDWAGYLAGAAVIGTGIWMLAGKDHGEAAASRLASTHGFAIVALGISISMDELAIGFTLGLVGLPVVPVIVAIAVLALVASQLGLALARSSASTSANAPSRWPPRPVPARLLPDRRAHIRLMARGTPRRTLVVF